MSYQHVTDLLDLWVVRLLWTLAMLFTHSASQAQMSVDVDGVYRFGPDVAESQACRLATEAAKMRAIEQVAGEFIRADRLLMCNERSDVAQWEAGSPCQLSQTLWSELSGFLLESTVLDTQITPYLGGRMCQVRMRAVVAQSVGEPDPSFDVAIALNRTIYRVGESIEMDIKPTTSGYLAVFNWAQIGDAKTQITRLMPLAGSAPLQLKGPQRLPAKGTLLEVGGFPVVLGMSEWVPPTTWPEYLIAVYTRKPIYWPESMDIKSLGQKLQQIPRKDVRWQTLVFQVIQKPQMKKDALQ